MCVCEWSTYVVSFYPLIMSIVLDVNVVITYCGFLGGRLQRNACIVFIPCLMQVLGSKIQTCTPQFVKSPYVSIEEFNPLTSHMHE